MSTIKKQVRDMWEIASWVSPEHRWDGSVVIDDSHGIRTSGKYFPTKKQAEAYADELLKELSLEKAA